MATRDQKALELSLSLVQHTEPTALSVYLPDESVKRRFTLSLFLINLGAVFCSVGGISLGSISASKSQEVNCLLGLYVHRTSPGLID
jgi:hypothetical protein